MSSPTVYGDHFLSDNRRGVKRDSEVRRSAFSLSKSRVRHGPTYPAGSTESPARVQPLVARHQTLPGPLGRRLAQSICINKNFYLQPTSSGKTASKLPQSDYEPRRRRRRKLTVVYADRQPGGSGPDCWVRPGRFGGGGGVDYVTRSRRGYSDERAR